MSPSAACASLKDAFPALTLLPTAAADEDPYQRSKDMLWSNATILDPACIFAPATAEELGQALARIVRLGLPFAVRCGGHMPNRGCNSIGSVGVLISLHELSSVEYASDTGVARVGVGARWVAVYQALLPHNVTVAGGTNGAPAVGGLTLGGGLGFFYGQVGYTADTAVNFQVVLPSGTVVDANATAHADLFWALKGGSTNFGIVTRIDFRTLPSDGVWAGMQLFGGDQYEPAIAAMDRFLESGLGDAKVTLQFAFPAAGMLAVNMFYDGPGDGDGRSPPSALAGFTALNANASTLAYTTCAAAALASAGSQPNGLRRLFNTLTIANDGSLLRSLAQSYRSAAAEMGQVPGFSGMMLAMALSESFLAKSGSGPAGIDANGTELILVIHLSTWTSAADDAAVQAWTSKTTAALQSAAREQGKLHPFLFLNDAGTDQDVFGGYAAEKRQQLQDISRRYDPARVLQRLKQGGFKIGE